MTTRSQLFEKFDVELYYVASLLYDAINISKSAAAQAKTDSELGLDEYKKAEFSGKQTEIRKIRELSSLITEKGAMLYDLLEKEIELKRLRQDAINKPPDIDGIGRDIQKAIQSIDNEINKTVKLLDNVATDEANLESKTANRHEELERLQKRLKSLGSVRPAFMDEYEAEEKKLEKLYTEYIIRFRNLTYLESQLEEFHQASQRDLDAFDSRVESAKRQSVFNAMNNADHAMGIGGGRDMDDINDDDLNDSEDEVEDGFQKRNDRPGGASALKKGPLGAKGGNKMYGDEDDDSDEDEDDSENEDDDDDEDEDLNIGADGSEDEDDEDDDDEDDDNFDLDRQSRPRARGGKKGKGQRDSKGRFGASESLGQDEDDDDNF
ncbi:clusterin-associated protein 1 homolog isoform X2 [Symsagittifera roscoffensis]|uniref:clusterin-associated protein 1 homolog isoform X2 n=1 Tax=Symsagittifera roscoffensis TaxID=84072 RepID=UPI00307B210B